MQSPWELMILKKLSVLGLSAIIVLGNVEAKTVKHPSNSDNEIQVGSIAEQNVWGQWQGKSSSASVDRGFVFDATFLYWQAKEDGLEYASKLDVTLLPNLFINKGGMKDLSFSWDPGSKISIGYIFEDHQQWDLSLTWTYLFSRAHGSASANDPNLVTESLLPLWVPFILGSEAQTADAKWQMRFNALDFGLARNYFVGKYVAYKPFIGVRGVVIDQHYSAKYRGAHTINNVVHLFDSHMRAINDFGGGGLRVGSDLQWFMSSNWSVLANISGSLIYGRFKIHELFNGLSSVNVFTQPQFFDYADRMYRVNPSLDGKLGIQWNKFFCNSSYRVSFGAFYDLSYWFDQNQLINLSTTVDNVSFNALTTAVRARGALQFQGVSCNARLEF